jgi:CBS domain-containing protein
MLHVREIMTTGVVSVTPETTLRDAIELLATRHLSGAPVVSGRLVVGVVSATDLMLFLARLPGVPTGRPVSEELGDDVVVNSDDVDDENDPPAAYFTDMWPDAGADTSARFEHSETMEWDALEEHDVSEVMTRTPLSTVSPDDTVEFAAQLMLQERIHRVLVTDVGELVGIVSSLDITKAAADHRFSTRTYVFNHDQEFRDQVR